MCRIISAAEQAVNETW